MPEKVADQKNSGSCFWAEGWRSNLCVCSDCKKMYEKEEVSFLLDPLDSVQAYEEAGKSNPRETQYEKGMRALASLDHVQQLDAIEGERRNYKTTEYNYLKYSKSAARHLLLFSSQEYNNMKDNLKNYLRKFVENKKVVREEDIKEFFSEMESKKRPKVVVPTYCR